MTGGIIRLVGYLVISFTASLICADMLTAYRKNHLDISLALAWVFGSAALMALGNILMYVCVTMAYCRDWAWIQTIPVSIRAVALLYLAYFIRLRPRSLE